MMATPRIGTCNAFSLDVRIKDGKMDSELDESFSFFRQRSGSGKTARKYWLPASPTRKGSAAERVRRVAMFCVVIGAADWKLMGNEA